MKGRGVNEGPGTFLMLTDDAANFSLGAAWFYLPRSPVEGEADTVCRRF